MKASNREFTSGVIVRCGAIALAALLAIAGTSQAAILTISTGGGDTVTLDSSDQGVVTPLGGDLYSWSGQAQNGDQWAITWDLEIDPDPFVGGAIGITNLTNMTQTVDVTVTELVGIFIPAGASMNGQSVLTLLDVDNDGSATMSAPSGSSIYTAMIDGMTEMTLFDDPTSLTTTPAQIEFMSFTGNSSQDVNTSIGVRHHFEVSPGDQATVNSRFEVVPEPTAAVLACCGGFGLLLTRRRIG